MATDGVNNSFAGLPLSRSNSVNNFENLTPQVTNDQVDWIEEMGPNTEWEIAGRKKNDKRSRPESDDDDVRTNQRKAARKNSPIYLDNEGFEVSLTSKSPLPKQMALARLLRDALISNVSRIKIKSPYRVLIELTDKSEAEKLISCPKLVELDIRAQLTQEGNFSYGLVRGVDLEMSEEDILAAFECSVDIVSVRRLMRMSSDGQWVASETVRLCFKDSTCPEYLFAYGCRFPIEKYVFPVTQCSNCWRFGHPRKFCPRTKPFCPKCGEDHTNCETETFRCVNCKGRHMALDKKCPHFLKEKRIRLVMSELNVTYKRALDIEKKDCRLLEHNVLEDEYPTLREVSPVRGFTPVEPTTPVSSTRPWPSVNTAQKPKESVVSPILVSKTKRSILKNKKTSVNENLTADSTLSSGSRGNSHLNEDKNKKEWKFEWKKIFENIKEIVFSQKNMEQKIALVGKIIFEEVKSFLTHLFLEGEMLKNFFFSFYNG